MKLVVDLNRIKKLAKEKEEENWGFRSFLKSCGIPPHKIDAIAHTLCKRITAKIDCKACHNCCDEVLPLLAEDDIAECSTGLNISEAEFEKQYLEKVTDDKYTFNRKPCPFLKEELCSIYDFRPVDCRSYPHIQKKDLVSRLIGVIHNYSVCPIVFNVYEALKSEIWAMDADDDADEWEEFI